MLGGSFGKEKFGCLRKTEHGKFYSRKLGKLGKFNSENKVLRGHPFIMSEIQGEGVLENFDRTLHTVEKIRTNVWQSEGGGQKSLINVWHSKLIQITPSLLQISNWFTIFDSVGFETTSMKKNGGKFIEKF